MSKCIVLTITKKYFELILCGQKTIEYRKDIPYYRQVLTPDVREMILHYRHGIYMHCSVKKIDLIVKPDHLEKSPFITTPRCFAIHVENPRWVDYGTKS